ncbi:MAG: glycosyltransferase family 9 protein [Ignavibacteriales bacterium]|nr:MAG: glycosyltransferase family 9 protein [Ignavibacteriales bacterium]
MKGNESFSNFVYWIFGKLLGVREISGTDIGPLKKILIVRPHNQLGDLLAGVSLFRALKEKFPESHITLIVSPFNYPGMVKNKFIDRIFIFNKKRIFNPVYLFKFRKVLKDDYDMVIVPVVVSISFTSNLISRLANARIRIGAKSLDGKKNKSDYFFTHKVIIDWRRHPDSNVSERSLDIIRPFGINTTNYRSEITFDKPDEQYADKYIAGLGLERNEFLIGIHAGAGKVNNRWSLIKYKTLIEKLNAEYSVKIYLTGSKADKEEVSFIVNELDFHVGLFINQEIPRVAALISRSDLFISNDTGIMHVAGTTDTPQVSIFGPTNPFNWAPIGPNKLFVRKSDLIDDVAVDDVFTLCKQLLLTSKRNSISA